MYCSCLACLAPNYTSSRSKAHYYGQQYDYQVRVTTDVGCAGFRSDRSLGRVRCRGAGRSASRGGAGGCGGCGVQQPHDHLAWKPYRYKTNNHIQCANKLLKQAARKLAVGGLYSVATLS